MKHNFSYFIKRVLFVCTFCIIYNFIVFNFFKPIFNAESVIFKYAIHPFDICQEQPVLWNFIKTSFIYSNIFVSFLILNFISYKLFSYKKYTNPAKEVSLINNMNILNLKIGYNSSNNIVTLTEQSLFQNMLITGAIGTGKTSSAMYPFTKQLISYKKDVKQEKLGMLILDVKGNYYSKIYEFAKQYNRLNDLIVIDLSGKIKYNPLHKPFLKPNVLANRLKTILLLFSPNNSESFWLDKVEEILSECIKLCRLYNNGYVTFEELHNLVVYPNYYQEKINLLRNLFINNKFSKEDTYNLLSSLNFFELEYKNLDSRTLAILKSEITRITNVFISDYQIKNVFSPPKSNLNFLGFSDVLSKGKIVILKMNISEYKNLSKIIAAYLKLDFQSEVMYRLSKTKDITRPVCFISDEYQEYVTSSDADFFAQSREAKCINIVSTQSYTSLLNSINNQSSTKVIIQNLVNKLWFRTDDIFTIEDAQKQIGKEEKNRMSKTISENAKETNFNYLFNIFNSKNSNISESLNSYTQVDFVYDTNFFTQHLETFSCLAFLSDGDKIMKPQKLKLIPYFKDNK